MEITKEMQDRTVVAMLADMEQMKYGQNEYADYLRVMLSIAMSKTAFSLLKKGRYDAIKTTSWLRLVKHFNTFSVSSWKTAHTHTYTTMLTTLETCKELGTWNLLCDHAAFGKSYPAERFAENNKQNVVYIDCSFCATKSEFITEVAKRFGLERTTTYNKLWADATDELLLLDNPLLILDEFGDVSDNIIPLMKGLYNKADMADRTALGVMHIGADNLRKKFEDGIRRRKPGYAEYWSRCGNKFLDLKMGTKSAEYLQILQQDITLIVDLNLPGDLQEFRGKIIQEAYATTGNRSIKKIIAKYKKAYKKVA